MGAGVEDCRRVKGVVADYAGGGGHSWDEAEVRVRVRCRDVVLVIRAAA